MLSKLAYQKGIRAGPDSARPPVQQQRVNLEMLLTNLGIPPYLDGLPHIICTNSTEYPQLLFASSENRTVVYSTVVQVPPPNGSRAGRD